MKGYFRGSENTHLTFLVIKTKIEKFTFNV